MAQLKITQIKSIIGQKPKPRESVRSLGLKRIHHSVLVEDTPQARGYLRSARHLLDVEVVDEGAPAAGAKRASK